LTYKTFGEDEYEDERSYIKIIDRGKKCVVSSFNIETLYIFVKGLNDYALVNRPYNNSI
jgi:hypothetical protein